jgi:hypothetical protein
MSAALACAASRLSLGGPDTQELRPCTVDSPGLGGVGFHFFSRRARRQIERPKGFLEIIHGLQRGPYCEEFLPFFLSQTVHFCSFMLLEIDLTVLFIWIISKLVEGQRAGIGKRLSDSRGPERKSSCWQS